MQHRSTDSLCSPRSVFPFGFRGFRLHSWWCPSVNSFSVPTSPVFPRAIAAHVRPTPSPDGKLHPRSKKIRNQLTFQRREVFPQHGNVRAVSVPPDEFTLPRKQHRSFGPEVINAPRFGALLGFHRQDSTAATVWPVTFLDAWFNGYTFATRFLRDTRRAHAPALEVRSSEQLYT